jgi:Icc-related predicted phosphoesterase
MSHKIVAISDLHGHLPEIEPCDFLLIGGDICPHRTTPGTFPDMTYQARWLNTTFRDWLDKAPAKHVIATWGNHDFIGQKAPDLVPHLRWKLLVDRGATVNGVRVYGTPWQPSFYNWAFNGDSEEELERKWRWIPSDTDLLVLHGPPRGYGDYVPANLNSPNAGEHTGSTTLLDKILKVKPKLTIFGHIHAGRGVYEVDGVKMANVSVLDDAYRMVHKPMVFEV